MLYTWYTLHGGNTLWWKIAEGVYERALRKTVVHDNIVVIF